MLPSVRDSGIQSSFVSVFQKCLLVSSSLRLCVSEASLGLFVSSSLRLCVSEASLRLFVSVFQKRLFVSSSLCFGSVSSSLGLLVSSSLCFRSVSSSLGLFVSVFQKRLLVSWSLGLFVSVFRSLSRGVMAQNETHPLLQILKSFNLGDMMLAFFLSVLVGLLLGALVYVLLTWASRRKKASARITRRPPKSPSGPSDPPLGPPLYRSTFLSVCRQPSLEPVGPLGSKPPGDSSTFRPAKKIRPGLEMGEDTVDRGGDTEDRRGDTVEDRGGDTVEDTKPNKRHSFWLGTNGLKGFLPPQSAPPPAYDSVIRAYEETCT